MQKNGNVRRVPLRLSDRPHGKVVPLSVKGYSEAEICSHAIQRMKQRGVSTKEVVAAIENPTMTGLRTEPGRFRVRRDRNNREAVDVIYAESRPGRLVVITVIVVRGRAKRRRK